MADDLARRREIRRRKILESSEARLKKIANSSSKKSLENDSFCHGDDREAYATTQYDQGNEDNNQNNFKIHAVNKFYEDDFSISPGDTPSETETSEDQLYRSRLVESDSKQLHSANGDFVRSCSPDYYTFPKKVSDAETRSFGRTRSDVRRNSSCTQIVMETLQFSSFSLTVLRFWLVAMTAFFVKMYFLFSKDLPIFQTIFIPFLMLEVALFSWSKLEAQVCSRPVVSSIISGVLLLCGLPSTVISRLNSVWNIINCLLVDLCVYVFSFVFLHFIFETCV